MSAGVLPPATRRPAPGLSGEAVIRTTVMAALALVPAGAAAWHQPFYVELMSRIMIFAIAGVSLNLIVGFGGMVSFGHAAFLGLGAYAVGLSIYHGATGGALHLALVLATTGSFAALMGALCLRTGGLYFIMITLAFAQFLFFVGVGLRQYGGDDGFTFRGGSYFAPWLDLGNRVTLYYVIWGALALCLLLVYRLVHSRFGVALQAARSNERRVTTLGLPAYRYRLVAFVIAGMMCGVAGGLLANLAHFVSPAYMSWTRSGEILVIVIAGGLSSVFGPVPGAIVYLLLEEILSGYTEHWQVLLGPLLILLVLFARQGLMGALRMPGLILRRGGGHA